MDTSRAAVRWITIVCVALTLVSASAQPGLASPTEDNSAEFTLFFANASLGAATALASVVVWCGSSVAIARGHRKGTRWHVFNYVSASIHGVFAAINFAVVGSSGGGWSSGFGAFGVAHLTSALVSLGAALWTGSLPADTPPRVSWSPTSLTVRF